MDGGPAGYVPDIIAVDVQRPSDVNSQSRRRVEGECGGAHRQLTASGSGSWGYRAVAGQYGQEGRERCRTSQSRKAGGGGGEGTRRAAQAVGGQRTSPGSRFHRI